MQEREEKYKENLQRQEKLLQVVKRERDGLKKILDSYNDEDVLSGNYDQQKTARIQELERVVAEKEDLIQSLMAKMGTFSQKDDEVIQLRSQIVRMEKQIDELLNEVATLNQRLGKGEYDPKTTKVIPKQSSLFDFNDFDRFFT